MTLIEALTRWVAVQTGLVLGTELFMGWLPAEAQSDIIVILERGGDPSKPVLQGNVGDYAIQVLIRGETYFQARDLAILVHDVLADCAGAMLTDWTLHVCEAMAEPQFLGFDEKGRFQFSVNYTARATNDVAWAAV